MVFVPFSDDNARLWIRYPYVTVAIIGACTLIFLWQAGLGPREGELAAYRFGLIPAVLWGNATLPGGVAVLPPEATLVTSVFLHGSWLHLIGNMLFLWVFGDNVEDAMGHGRFVGFYLLAGVVAGLVQAWSGPMADVPTVGASGAISGVLGAYFVLHPRVGVWGLLFSIIPLRLPTVIVLGSWFAFNLLDALLVPSEVSGVAFWAHVGGFAAGALMIPFFKRPEVPLWSQGGSHRIKKPITLRSRRGPWGRRP